MLGKPNENSLGTVDVAEPIHVSILNHFADGLCAALAESDEVSSRFFTANMMRR